MFTLALAVASCTQATTPTPPAGSPSATSSATAPTAIGLADKPIFIVQAPGRNWYTVPDGLFPEGAPAAISFPAVDAAPGHPRARLRSTGRAVELAPIPSTNALGTMGPAVWTGTVPLDGAAPGPQTIDYLVRMNDGTDAVLWSSTFLLSQPEYIVWTLDFEGDASSDEAMANTWDIAQSSYVPMTIMWNPRVWTTTQVSRARADAMQQWMTGIANVGMAEIALHVHMWTDFVRAAGVTPRTAPSWAGRSDGYDVPITAFSESETRTLIDYSLKLMADHGLPRPTSFRAGGEFANAANLRAVAAAGFTADCSGVPAGAFGRLPLPWTLPADAQPYRPSPDDANAVGSLSLLEAPTIGGNTYGYDVRTIQPIIRADLSYLATAGDVAASRRAITIVSHPGTIDATERAAITALFDAFAPLRYDRDAGPVRFVTLAQLAQAWR